MTRGVSVVYVLVPHSARAEIAGYYTLASTAVRLEQLPQDIAKKLPRHPLVPATLIGRLAVSEAYRGRRLGERLLIDALKRSSDASQRVASVAVFVDAKDETGVAFYKRYGLTPLPEQPLRLFIPMRTIATLFGA